MKKRDSWIDLVKVIELYKTDLDKWREVLYNNFVYLLPKIVFNFDRTIYIHDYEDLESECFLLVDEFLRNNVNDDARWNKRSSLAKAKYIRWMVVNYIRTLDKEQSVVSVPKEQKTRYDKEGNREVIWWYPRRAKYSLIWWMTVLSFWWTSPEYSQDDRDKLAISDDEIDDSQFEIDFIMEWIIWLTYAEQKLLWMWLNNMSKDDIALEMSNMEIEKWWRPRDRPKVSRELNKLFIRLRWKINENPRSS